MYWILFIQMQSCIQVYMSKEEKKLRLTQGAFFSLNYFFIPDQQTKKSMTPAALIDISVLNENGPWFQFKWQHWVIK